ncbi:Putative short-chain dehydrogenase/reductase SDR, NAD(P)-binding domain superfamily [Septoria linicola]|uniref:Short-chain dehydrogenase/reductase SDR, NAD(P)-binding domain superfamily n=1 Tax=Septoria linicola TaxID=215465 RepID=A0A9Q9ATA3_9PEZI|nr:putative short-chain dehydrogenase/reductase SDR, NAD(P)-binding domain superfamily [Septoria linicola]USW52150.1 Putative short-chain dehydrogenase/reductase SDR, NAD(P)-binding domain superfamily [Septoria linicola]
MSTITAIRSANTALESEHSSLTAVFVGATSGIGLATLQAFAKHVPLPRAFVVGRSRATFQPSLDQLHEINPAGTYTFIESDISLLKNVDTVSEQIRTLINHGNREIDLLFLSQGYISFAGREDNADALDNSVSLRYYTRLRFTQNLLPLTSQNARIVSVLAGGKEGNLFEDDLDLKQNYSVGNAAAQFATMTTLSFDALAGHYPEKAFIHVFPGLTSTGLLGRSAKGLLGVVMRWVLEPAISLFASRPEDVGERMLYYATAEDFANGSLSLDWDGTSKENEALERYRRQGVASKVVLHNAAVFDATCSR